MYRTLLKPSRTHLKALEGQFTQLIKDLSITHNKKVIPVEVIRDTPSFKNIRWQRNK
jgi:hypothetical protein